MNERLITNGHEIRVVGMSRSGNHAVLHWIAAQADQAGRRVCQLNCVEGKTNPFTSTRPMDDGRRVVVNYRPFDLAAEQAGRLSRKDLLLFNQEDAFLGHACSDLYEQHHDAWVGRSARRTDVLILRDPYNLFASRRATLHCGVSQATAVRIWKQHARQFADGPTMLRHDPVLVLYNRWAVDTAYRHELAERLGLPFTDAGRQRVIACGGGSSFQGTRFDGRADAMSVHDRWRQRTADPAWRAIVGEPKLRDLAQRIFGEHPAARATGDDQLAAAG